MRNPLGLLLLLVIARAVRADIPGGPSFDVSGRWTVQISTPSGRIVGEAEFTQTGNQISGWLDLGDGDHIPISGVLYSGKLVLTTHPQPRRIVAFDRFEADSNEYHMKGAIFPGKGTIELRRYREPRPFRKPPHQHPPTHK